MKNKKRLFFLRFGYILLCIFCITTFPIVAYMLINLFRLIKSIKTFSDAFFSLGPWLTTAVVVFIIESVIFWAGIISVYLTSEQLGIRVRLLGIIFGWVPVANVIVLIIIICTCICEDISETRKNRINEKRKDLELCKTKYPLLMVHGVFFRDFSHLNYWGRIPQELETNGATIYYGQHNSAASVDNSASELAERIRKIVKETGCEKVNVIAHSKGGLDMRTAIAKEGISSMVATLTTINTPHRGCEFADYLLKKVPEKQKNTIAKTYNSMAAKLGDINPDFMAAVKDLTHENCEKRNLEVFDSPEVIYQSFGSKLNKFYSGRFPLNMSYHLVKYFDGPNDGLVGEKSFQWGDNYTFLTTSKRRGISHGDMIDLNRENFRGFDVREFYVNLVNNLKKQGY